MGRNKGKTPARSSLSIGRALQKSQPEKRRQRGGNNLARDRELLHTDDGAPAPILQSVTDESDLDRLLNEAQLADRKFEAENQHVVVLDRATFLKPTFTTLTDAQREEQLKYADWLRVPRRPKWTKSMSTDQLLMAEREAFLEWRRSLAELEQNEKLKLTPFERNLDIWRQLWRVVERAELVVQIVDAREPLLFRSADLERYVRELSDDKRNLLLVNKADLLTREQRQRWTEYFKANNIRHVFWSAVAAQSRLDAEAKAESVAHSVASHRRLDDDDDDKDDDDSVLELEEEIAPTPEEALQLIGSVDVLNRSQLIVLLEAACPPSQWRQEKPDAPSVVGFVGYPNVGKSSTINVLIAEKKTGVTSTPGKTKHFQTLPLSPSLMLCDCPGLVMPSFAMSTESMYLSGLLPIDRMRDPIGPTSLLCSRIGRNRLERHYNVVLPDAAEGEAVDRPPTGTELLEAYAVLRGFRSGGRGLPDVSRAARYVLKEYVAGTLLWCAAPPGHTWTADDLKGGGMEACERPEKILTATEPVKPTYNPVSDEAFTAYQENIAAHVKGRKGKSKPLTKRAARLERKRMTGKR